MIVIQKDCPNCEKVLDIHIDTSEGPLGEAGTECDCGAIPVWEVEWEYDVWISDYLRDEHQPAMKG